MKTEKIYRYINADGVIICGLNKPECEYSERVCIIADEGKAVTRDSETIFDVIYADSAEGWYEVDAPTEETAEEMAEEMAEE